MTGSTILQEKAQQLILEQINNAVELSHNPDLAKAVLFNASRDTFYIKGAVESLEVPEDEFEKIVNYLVEQDIITMSSQYEESIFDHILNNVGVEEYLSSELPFGKRQILKREFVDEATALKTMNSVKDFVGFFYSKQFRVEDLTVLGELRKRSHDLLKQIREAEGEYWHNALKIPEQYGGFPSFVSENDPTKSGGEDINFFGLRAQFASPEEAFEVGFDQVEGYPLTIKFQESKFLPKAVEIRKTTAVNEKILSKYNIFLRNICYDSNFYSGRATPLAYRLDAKHVMPLLQDALEKELD